MNVAALASRFVPEKTAATTAAKPAKPLQPTPSASAIVTLSGANPATAEAAAPTYSAPANFLNQKLLLPTRENVAMLAKAAGDALNAKLDQAGIPRSPAFELEIEDVNSAHVTVKGNRADAKAIEALVNSDHKLQMDIHNTEALASHIPGIERSMAYQQEYQAAKTQQQIDQVNARYADLLSGNQAAADIGLHYGATGIQVTINQQAV
ncbi:MAG: hypothetical protein KGZ83_09285 [Sulfuricella sp.]|nr:hypothetical protein [Sulfuricella sp.]